MSDIDTSIAGVEALCKSMDDLIDELRTLSPIKEKVTMPTRPQMPIGDLSYADWLAVHRNKLISYFKFWYGRNHASDEEWAEYCRAQYLAELEVERAAKEWL